MEFSQITPDLFIGPMPTADDYTRLYDLGVRLVLNMRFSRKFPAGVTLPPFEVLWLRTLDSPLFPMPLGKLAQGARAALDTIAAGGKIYTHCAHGRHRGVAMGAAVLIAQGHPSEAAMRLIKEKRSVADPGVFYIKSRILAFERLWQKEFASR